MLVLNTKQELLDWAVENIEGWEEEYTHLFCDDSPAPLFYSKRFELWYIDRDWTFDDSEFVTDFKGLEAGVKASTPLVVSKQEYMEAKNMKDNTFKLSDLKTGMRVTLSNGDIGYFFDAFHGHKSPEGHNQSIFIYLDGGGWDDLERLTYEGGGYNLSIVKVEYANNIMHLLTTLKGNKIGSNIRWDVLWERKEETEAQKKLRELKAKQEELVKSQQEVAKMISELEGNVK